MSIGKWTSVSKALPSEDGEYLVTIYDGHRSPEIRVATFIDFGNHQVWEDDYHEIVFDYVKAWAELPTPYYPRKRGA